MPSGRSVSHQIGLGEYEYEGSSQDELRQLFLLVVRRDVRHALQALRDLQHDDAIPTWAREYHLEADWLLEVALRTREQWRRDPGLARHLEWAVVMLSGEQVPEPAAIQWSPTIETEAEFKTRVKKYIADVRHWAKAGGLVPPVQKRQVVRNLAAFAQSQVKGDDLEAVADDHFGGKENTDAAEKALRAIGRLIDLPWRGK